MGRRTIGMPSARPGLAAAVALVGVLVGAGALAGCESEATPPVTSSPSATATGTGTGGSPSPSVTSPSPSVSATVEVPAAAREKTEKGAEAFVRFFMTQAAAAWTAPDASLIETYSTKDCGACADLADVAKSLEADGQRYDGPPVSVVSLKLLRSNATEVAFEARLMENEVSVVSDSGAVVDSYPRREITRAIAVKWGNDRWRVHGIGE